MTEPYEKCMLGIINFSPVNQGSLTSSRNTEAYSEPCLTSKMERFKKIFCVFFAVKHFRKTFYRTIMFIIFWDFLMFQQISFHHKWNETWLLVPILLGYFSKIPCKSFNITNINLRNSNWTPSLCATSHENHGLSAHPKYPMNDCRCPTRLWIRAL